MQVKPKTVAPALRALLDGFIDYAGLFPPAALPLDEVLKNYSSYQNGDFNWMLRWLVVGGKEFSQVPKELYGAIALLGETDDERVASIESRGVVRAARPVYCEVAPGSSDTLDAIKAAGCFAKIRTGAMKAEGIPSVEEVSQFILGCTQRRLAFKATAGLHHPVRAEKPLTYEPGAPRAVMHGFLNVLMASAFSWHGEQDLVPVLAETDVAAFSFDDRAHWRDRSLDVEQIKHARTEFMHAVGTCSFTEPVEELQELGFL